MRLGQRFESARRLSVLFALYSLNWHQEVEAFLPRFTTFAEGSKREHDDISSMHNYELPASLEFRALISECVEHRDLVMVCVKLLKPRDAWYHKSHAHRSEVRGPLGDVPSSGRTQVERPGDR